MSLECHHVCPDCDNGIEYHNKEALGAHRAEVHFECQYCGLVLASKRSFQTHLIYEHAACEVCFEVFHNMEFYRVHMRMHSPCEYGCPGCETKSATFSTIMRHLESSSACGGLHQVMRLVRETPRFRDFYIPSASGFDFYCKSCFLRWATLGELAQHLETDAYCEWLLGPEETFSFLCQLLALRHAHPTPSILPFPFSF